MKLVIKGILGAVLGFGIYFFGGTLFMGGLNQNYWSVFHGVVAVFFGIILSLEKEIFNGYKWANLIKFGVVLLFLMLLSL